MMSLRVSDKGQITLPAVTRRKLGICRSSLMEMDVRGDEIVLRLVPPIGDARGVFKRYTQGKTDTWERVRTEAEESVAAECIDG
jgi:AbrB family looped-hinge helix DNA binding protein